MFIFPILFSRQGFMCQSEFFLAVSRSEFHHGFLNELWCVLASTVVAIFIFNNRIECTVIFKQFVAFIINDTGWC